MGPAVAAGSRAAVRALWAIALGAVASTALACLLKLPGLPHQSNAPLILALAPVWCGLALGTRALARPRGQPS